MGGWAEGDGVMFEPLVVPVCATTGCLAVAAAVELGQLQVAVWKFQKVQECGESWAVTD